MKKMLVATTVAILVGAGTATVASAALVNEGGVIHACVGALGVVRIVNSTNGKQPACHAGEHALSWNQTGPAGPPGPTADLTGDQMVSAEFAVPAASDRTSGNVICPFGHYIATGGGYQIENSVAPGEVDILASVPADGVGGSFDGTQPSEWRVDVRNNTGRPFNGRTIFVKVWASCGPGDPGY